MQCQPIVNSYARSLALVALLSVYVPAAHATDSYDLSNGQLTIPSLAMGTMSLSNVVVTVGSIVSGPTGAYPNTPNPFADSYDPSLNQLTVSSVTVGSRTYIGVVITVGGLVSIGGATGTDTYSGGLLSIPAVQLVGGAVYTQVVITLGSIVSIGHGLPTVTQNEYDPTTHLLTIPAIQVGSTVYTNVKVTPGSIKSVGGAEFADSVLHSFSGATGQAGAADGANSNFALLQASDGNFYGTTPNGGAYGQGTVFKMTAAGVESVIYSFSGNGGVSNSTDGAEPESTLIQGTDGNLYGTTYLGGAYNQGAVFKVTPSGSETVLYSFSGCGFQGICGITGSTDGANPNGMIQGSDGYFYGTTYGGGANTAFGLGGGTVFRVTPAGIETVLHSFSGAGIVAGSTDGAAPISLMQGSDGNFYGTTETGGAYYVPFGGQGVVFKLTAAGAESVLYSFAGGGAVSGSTDSGSPGQDPLVEGSDGNFYGTASNGGTYNQGTVYRITPPGLETVLYSFSGNGGLAGSADAAFPYAGLVLGSDGNFYGTTDFGGAYNNGAVYRITPAGTETVLYSFSGAGALAGSTDGAGPAANLIQGTDGNFYGTTYYGGAYNEGVLFRLAIP
jgi:uncharacterized repeat protein (TIGR03803 family)